MILWASECGVEVREQRMLEMEWTGDLEDAGYTGKFS
jgi:hypothetical protein